MPDHSEIARAIYAYADCMDAGDFDGVADLLSEARVRLAPDAAPITGHDLVGHLRSAVICYPDGTPRTHHLVTNVDVQLEGDIATARSRYLVLQQVEGRPLLPLAAGRYRDVFERSDAWRWVEREYTSMDLVGDLSLHLRTQGIEHVGGSLPAHSGATDCGDRREITDVLHRYAKCLDERDWPGLDGVFAHDVSADYSGRMIKGRPEVVAYIRRMLDDCGPSQHLLGNVTVELKGDHAETECAARVFHVGSGARAGLEPFECWGDYRDRLVRTPDGWRIVHRTFDVRIQRGDIGVLGPADRPAGAGRRAGERRE